MDSINDLLEKIRSFERTVHTPFGTDVVVTGTTLCIVAAVALILIAIFVALCIARKRTERPVTMEYARGETIELGRSPLYPPVQTPDPVADPSFGPVPGQVTAPAMEPQFGGFREPAAEAVPAYAPAPVAEPAPEPVPEPAPEPVPEPAPEPVPEPAPEPIPQPIGPQPIVLFGHGGYFDRKQITQQGAIVIGRHPMFCTLVYPEDTVGVSKSHCRVQRNGDSIYVTDLGSKCGTFVNGEQLRANVPFRLQKGDTFWLGERTNSFFVG